LIDGITIGIVVRGLILVVQGAVSRCMWSIAFRSIVCASMSEAAGELVAVLAVFEFSAFWGVFVG
jgi:hypothetical protein